MIEEVVRPSRSELFSLNYSGKISNPFSRFLIANPLAIQFMQFNFRSNLTAWIRCRSVFSKEMANSLNYKKRLCLKSNIMVQRRWLWLHVTVRDTFVFVRSLQNCEDIMICLVERHLTKSPLVHRLVKFHGNLKSTLSLIINSSYI